MAVEDEESTLRLLQAISGNSANYKLNPVDLAKIVETYWANQASWAKSKSERFGFVLANPPYNPDYLRDIRNWMDAFKAYESATEPAGAKPPFAALNTIESLHTLVPTTGMASTYLEAVTKSVEQLRTDLKEAEELRQLLVEFIQVQQLRRESAELYGRDPETGQTAAQEYLAFKKAQREQQSH